MLTSNPNPRASLAAFIADTVRAEIVSGLVAPGEPIVELALAARFQASRAPVREAMSKLTAEGLLRLKPNGRTIVISLEQQDFVEILQTRSALESMAARLAAPSWTKEDSSAVRAFIARQQDSQTLAELSQLDVEMHSFMVSRCGNGRLFSLWRQLLGQFSVCLAYTHRIQGSLDFNSRNASVQLHSELLEAFETRDGETAATAAAGHVDKWAEWLPKLNLIPSEETRKSSPKTKRIPKILPLLFGGFLALLGNGLHAAEEGQTFFETKIQPILINNCYECHSHSKRIRAGLALDYRSGWEKGGDSGPAIVPGKPEDSLLITAIKHEDKDTAMPPKKKLGDAEIELLVHWVKIGAPDPRITAPKHPSSLEEGRKHWAFQPVGSPAIPSSSYPERSNSPIDAFLFEKMASRGLSPAPLADRSTLLRRVSYDLTGLPPTASEIRDFVRDPRSEREAFSAVVDRLLANSAYGEKWGRRWLDLAHFSDTTGCSSDWPIDDAWRYRDWVVDALNQDMPFPQFLTEQIAGDLLAADMLKAGGLVNEEVYRKRIVATGFLATAKRFGSNPNGFEHLTVGDTLDTTWKALQGLTMGCARCHDHKFEPISNKDYYALYGIFSSSHYPYVGAELNHDAAVLVPLSPRNADSDLNTWNRKVLAVGGRTVLASYSNAWSFEDAEKSEAIETRMPGSPWLLKGEARAVATASSSFTHLFPKGTHSVEFSATTEVTEMLRRVRWWEAESQVRSIGLDFQLTRLWNGQKQSLTLAWRSAENPSSELELARLGAGGFCFPGAETVPVDSREWHHLSLQYMLNKDAVLLQIWAADGKQIASATLPCSVTKSLQLQGDLIIRFETQDLNGKQEACIRIDNIIAESSVLPRPEIAGAAPSQPAVKPTNEQKAAAQEQLNALYKQKPATAFAMWEGTPHDAALQKRGEPEALGNIVPRRNLELFGGKPVSQPTMESGRRDLAEWLLADSNPLTLRVFVNRIWQGHFGRGIVASLSDFGHTGETPTHPELLDYLVQTFRASGFSMKALHREILLSDAYRRSSTPTATSGRNDHDNIWLSHFTPRRLTAEEIRDSFLYVSGLLDPQGPGHRQPFPASHQRNWSQHHPFSLDYEANYKLYASCKRSLYLPSVRLVADPFLSTFDGANSNQSVALREETNVPLQSLAMINAPVVVESANQLRIAALGRDANDALKYLYLQIFGTEPDPVVQQKLAGHFQRMLTERQISKEDALSVTAQSLLSSNAFFYIY